jgi:ribosomal protein S18 acetylase RimI-like enzyme
MADSVGGGGGSSGSSAGPVSVRAADPQRDADAIWSILEPVIRAGETYTLPRDMSRADALRYWLGADHRVFVAEDPAVAAAASAASAVVGTFYIRPNQKGGGAHVANFGFMTASAAAGRGVARAMCARALAEAASMGFRAVQFNFVVSTNVRAIAIWESFGFRTLARLPGAFEHPRLGAVDALLMWRDLDAAARQPARPRL